ncbi:glycosyl transferase, partial [Streptomyces sp. SID89]|nr:glycosyl transferase [Streptomyces sp. SID89]
AALRLLGDPGRRRAMGEAARLRVIEQFTLRQTIDTFRSVYLELSERRPAPAPVAQADALAVAAGAGHPAGAGGPGGPARSAGPGGPGGSGSPVGVA